LFAGEEVVLYGVAVQDFVLFVESNPARALLGLAVGPVSNMHVFFGEVAQTGIEVIDVEGEQLGEQVGLHLGHEGQGVPIDEARAFCRV